MRLLIAPVAFLEPLAVEIRSAFGPLGDLLKASQPDIIEFHCKSIKDDMEDSALSGWFSLFVQAVFRHVSEDDIKFDLLLAAVSRVNEASAPALRELRRTTIMKHRDLFLEIEALRQERSHLMVTSYYQSSNGESIFDRDEKLTAQIVGLEEQKKPMLALFLIAEKIIIILQELQHLNLERVTEIKQKIIENPIKFIAHLIPILGLLQKGESSNLEEVIALTLQLVDLNNAVLPSTIQEELLKRKWVEFKTLQEAPEEQAGAEDQDVGRATGCCLVSAISHFFFRQRRRGSRVTPLDVSQQETNAGDIGSVNLSCPEGSKVLLLTTGADALESEIEIEEEDDWNEAQTKPTLAVNLSPIYTLGSPPRQWLGAVEVLDTIVEEDETTKNWSC